MASEEQREEIQQIGSTQGQAESSGDGESRSASGRDDGTVLIAAYHFLVSGMFLLATLVLALPIAILGIVAITEAVEALIGLFAVGLIAAVTMVFSLIYISIGYGLWTMKQWGRIGAIALAVIGLFAFPVGTLIGALILWHLFKPEVAARFT